MRTIGMAVNSGMEEKKRALAALLEEAVVLSAELGLWNACSRTKFNLPAKNQGESTCVSSQASF
jgi:hypothetical protein